MLTLVELVTGPVVTENGAACCPAGTMTLAWTWATVGVSPERIMTAPPDGAKPSRTARPVAASPPQTDGGTSETEATPLAGGSGTTSTPFDIFLPRTVAVIVMKVE